MYNERNNTATSRASEAIVSEDGRVRRRLNNYETTIDVRAKNRVSAPTGAVNDNDGNINMDELKLPPAPPAPPSSPSRLNRYRYVTLIGSVVLFGCFLWSLTFFIEPTIKTLQSDSSSSKISSDEALADQLEHIANLIVSDGQWNESRINSFLDLWNNTSEQSRDKFKNLAWYQHFTYRLQNKIKRERIIGAYPESQDNKKKADHPYMLLAKAMGISDSKMNYIGSTSNRDIDEIYKKLAKEVEEELTNLDQVKQKPEQDQSTETDSLASNANATQAVGSAESTVATEQVTTQDPPQPLAMTTAQDIIKAEQANISAQNPLPAKPAAIQPQGHPVAVSPMEIQQAAITDADVKKVLEKYSTAYEAGNTEQLTSLFGVTDKADGHQIVAELKSNFDNVFKNSSKRSLTFGEVNWENRDGKASVKGNYTAKAELTDNKGTQTISADAHLELNKHDDELRISKFELLNRKVSVISPMKLAPQPKLNFKTERPDTPTAAELQDLVTRLVSSYESGDLELFSSLFAPNAKTNDRNDLKSIKSDYKKLFASSNDRQMFIQRLHWTKEKDYAKGRGDLEAMVLQSGNSVYSMSGKIEIVAKRIDGKVLITRLYHLEREK